MTAMLLGMCVLCGVGQYFQPRRPPQLLPRLPRPTDTPTTTKTTTPQQHDSNGASVPSTAAAPNPSPPQSVKSESTKKQGTIRHDWHGKLQLVERHPRTGAVKNSSKWTDIKIAVERTGQNVLGEVHFVETNVFAAVRGQLQDSTCQLIVERVLSGPGDTVIVPCVLTGKLDAKQVFRGHWNPGVLGTESSHHPRFWLSQGPQP